MARMGTTSSGTGDLDLVAIANEAPYSGNNAVTYAIHTPLGAYETGTGSVVGSRLAGRTVVTSSSSNNAISVPQPPSGVVVTLSAQVVPPEASGDGLADGNYGDITVSGSGTAMAINAGAVDTAAHSATGTPSASTFLRGDGSWATPAGSGDVAKVGTPANNQVGIWTGDGTIEGDAALTFDTSTDTLDVGASGTISIGGVALLDDAAGTTTLKNIDAIDATTEATLLAALDISGDGAASAAEVNTGTSTTKSITPDAFAGSNAGIRLVEILAGSDYTSDAATGNGQGYFVIPAAFDGMNLVYAAGSCITAGTTGTATVMVRNVTQAADMLTTPITFASGATAAGTVTPAVIDAANDDVATGDQIAIDVDTLSTTKQKGVIAILGFQLP